MKPVPFVWLVGVEYIGFQEFAYEKQFGKSSTGEFNIYDGGGELKQESFVTGWVVKRYHEYT